MTRAIYFMAQPWMAALTEPPPATPRGPMYANHGFVFARGRLATDSVGLFTLTLTNIVIGSVIRVEVASTGAEIETRTADAATEVFTVPAYAAGSANNDLRIKVRKGSASAFYKPYETLATALVGSGSVYIAQIPD